MSEIEVTRIPTEARPELTKIQPEILEYFASQGKQAFLAHGTADAMAWQSAFQCSPVYWDDIHDDVLKKKMRAWFAPPERTAGIVMRGTMTLVEQSLEARDYFRGDSERKKMAMMDASDNAAEEIEEQINKIAHERNPNRKGKFVDVRQVAGPKVEEQAVGGQQLLEQMLQAKGTTNRK